MESRRILITGLSSYLGGRLAQALEREPAVEALIGVDVEDPRHELQRTEFVRSEIGRICAKKLELDVNIGSRSLLLPVSAAFLVIPMMPSVKLVAHKLDTFISAYFREKTS